MGKVNSARAAWLCALAAASACGGNTVGGPEEHADSDPAPERAAVPHDPEPGDEHGLEVCPDIALPAPPSEADENWSRALASGEVSLDGLPAALCGVSDGDEGSAAEPQATTFETLLREGYRGSVGIGASCYRVEGVLDGYQFFVEAGDEDVDLYVYSHDGFATEPICLNQDEAGWSVHCTTYPREGPDLESAVRYLVIDGSKTEGGASFELTASG